MSYDLCILGAGPAGFAAAVRAHDLGKRVLLVAEGPLGGAGLAAGALSSKTMWHLANDYGHAIRTDRGYRAHGVELSYGAVMQVIESAVLERRSSIARQLEGLVGGDTGPTVELVRGRGQLMGPHRLRVSPAQGAAFEVECPRLLVATGSKPRVPPGIEVDGTHIITSDHIETLSSFPRHMTIVGAGVVGCEYATIFAAFRQTRLHLIDQQRRILPFEDEDVASVIEESFQELGITIHRSSQVRSLTRRTDHVTVCLDGPAGELSFQTDCVLIAAGRSPCTTGLGLETCGVALDRRGGICATDTQSSVPWIYAAGDVTCDIALVNVAELEGRQAVERMFEVPSPPIRYDAISTILFLRPEVAAVGWNEREAQKRGVGYRVARVSNSLVSRNVAMRSTRGFVKLLVTDKEPARIVGLRVVGPQASSTAQGIALLIETGASVEDIEACLHPHPSVPEGVQECARLILGRSLFRPAQFPEAVRLAYEPPSAGT